MNTKIKIIAMLMAMIIGTLAANAQSARRGDTQKRTSTTSKSYSKPSTKSKSTTTRQAPVSRSTQSKARSVQRTQPQRATRGPVAQTQTRTSKPNARVQTQSKQRTSTTTRYNPKSTYRQPDKTVHTGKTYVNPKPGNSTHNNNKVYKGNKKLPHNANTKTHHRHYYYPVDRVKIHVHPMTYRGNYRALYYPRYSEIYWNRSMRRHYVSLYPRYTGWHYNYGYRIQTMSVFDARYNVGEIARVYGRVYATWHNPETDDLLLFFGGEYPNQVFTLILPGKVARRYSWRPERYFLGQHVSSTGLITEFEGQAEMVIKKKSQINVY